LLFREFNREIPDVFCLDVARSSLTRPPAPSSATLQRLAQLLQFFGCAHRENFHAAIAAVSDIPVHIQLAAVCST